MADKQPPKSEPKEPAAAAPKRTFVPNLGVKREKKDVEADRPSETQQRNRQFQPNVGRGRGRGGRQSNFIQTKSIFEAGPAESTKKHNDKESYSTSSLVVGSITRTEIPKSAASSDGKASGERAQRHKMEFISPDELLLDDSIKDEIGPFVKLESVKDKTALKKSKSMDDLNLLKEALIDNNVNSEATDDNLFLFQMVDCLKLTELPDGKIGKLKVYKSGKIELCLGNTIKLDVSLASDALFLQDVINVQVDETTETGTMTCIGHVKNKILCTPQFD